MTLNESVNMNNTEKSGMDEFGALLENYLPGKKSVPRGEVVKVPIVAIHSDAVLVDIGGKSEGLITISEFKDKSNNVTVKVGDVIEVIIGGWDEETGQRIISHKAAKEIAAIDMLEKAVEDQTIIKGRIINEVKGGLIVDIGIPAFMPASQVDLYKAGELSKYIGQEIEALVLEFNKGQRRAIISRRRLLEIEKEKNKVEFYSKLKPGELITVTVKRIFDYGAFCEIAQGVDGLLPREEISYDKGSHPSQFVKEGDKISVKIVSADPATERITLSRKQLLPDPWASIDEKYPVGKTIEGKVVSVTTFGAFVYLEEGITGMIHVSDMTWDKKARRPSDYVKDGDFVQVVILEYDKQKRRLALGMKQTLPDPWANVEEQFPVNSIVKGKVISIANFGAFVKLAEGIEGMVHVSDISWEKKISSPSQVFKVDDEIEAVVLNIDKDTRRISLGVKQLSDNPIQLFLHSHKMNDIVKGKVKNVAAFGVFVELAPMIEALIPVAHLAAERIENPEAKFKPGDEIEAKIIKLDEDSGKISLSIKELISDREKEELKAFTGGNIAAGTNIGELLNELEFKLDDSFLDSEGKETAPKAEETKAPSLPKSNGLYSNMLSSMKPVQNEEEKKEEPKAEEEKNLE